MVRLEQTGTQHRELRLKANRGKPLVQKRWQVNYIIRIEWNERTNELMKSKVNLCTWTYRPI